MEQEDQKVMKEAGSAKALDSLCKTAWVSVSQSLSYCGSYLYCT